MSEKGDMTTDTIEIQKSMRDYCASKLDNLNKMINVSPRNTKSIKTKLWTNRKSK